MKNNTQPRIGVLAIQGNYASHAQALAEAGAEPIEVRKPEELAGLDGLILPGGESTTMLRFLEKHSFFELLQEFCRTKPVFGTCAGVILLARRDGFPALVRERNILAATFHPELSRDRRVHRLFVEAVAAARK